MVNVIPTQNIFLVGTGLKPRKLLLFAFISDSCFQAVISLKHPGQTVF